MSSNVTEQEPITEQKLTQWAQQAPVSQKPGQRPERIRFAVIYASWCGHCKNLQAKLREMFTGRPLDEQGFPQTPYTKFVESDNAKQLKNVLGFPTVRKYVNGKPQQSSPDELEQFLRDNVLSRRAARSASPDARARGPGPAVAQARPQVQRRLSNNRQVFARRPRSPEYRVRRDFRPQELVYNPQPVRRRGVFNPYGWTGGF